MTNSKPDEELIASILDWLCVEHVHTAMSTFESSLAGWKVIWRFVGLTVGEQVDLNHRFEYLAAETVEKKGYERRTFDSTTPPSRNYRARADEITEVILGHIRGRSKEGGLEYLGKLAGAWILVCPRQLIELVVAESRSATWTETEQDLVTVLQVWLHNMFV